MPWAVAAAGVSAAAGLAGSAMSSGATSSAANASRAQQEMAYKIADAKLAPYYSAGTDALGQVVDLTRGGWGDYQNTMRAGFQTDPGYEFALQQGLRGVDAGAAARGITDSGATRKAEIGYAEGLANQQYNQYVSRFDNYVNRLYALAGAGQNSATQSATTALNTGNNLSNISLGQGAADANIYGNAAKGISNSVNSLFGNQDFRNWLNSGSGGSSIYGNAASGTPGISAAGNPVMTGYAPSVGADAIRAGYNPIIGYNDVAF